MNRPNARLTAILAYLTWITWFIAYFIHDKTDEYEVHHLNQALVLNILKVCGGVLAILPFIGKPIYEAVGLIVAIFWIIAMYRAITFRTDPLPIIGDIRIVD